eukprot:TRINITY_DN2318_c0_g1_i1.p1 TRINITY_DN2318_c0_g1~~TRINITY_DN2318_c0_g1_i1.p1  ORF type:complete len:293 (-),score=86.42 TRINITY_DN2318_c0_g1_i1:155-1033(-)
MVKIFVIGATGFIGSSISIALRAKGHQVYGLVRTPEKAKVLLAHEVNVVAGSLDTIQEHAALIRECSAVFFCASDSTQAVKTLISLCTTPENVQTFKKRFVLISGCLMYVENELPVNEEAPLNASLPRFQTEKLVLTSPEIEGVVLRPTFLYGKSGSYMGAWWKQFHAEGKVQVKGRPDKKYNLIHVDDLADGAVKVIEAPSGVVSGQVFNLGDGTSASVLEIAKTLAKVAGFKGEIEVVPNGNKYDEYFDRHARVDSSKAARLLGWFPRHIGLLEEAETYYSTWKAYNNIH